MSSVVYPVVALLALIALAYKIPPLIRDPRSATRRALAAMLFFLVWAPTANTPFIYVRIDELLGVPNIARLIAHSGILGFAVSVQLLLLHWTVSDPPRRATWFRVAAVAAGVAAMTVLFVLAPLDVTLTREFTTVYGDAPYMAEYMIVYLGYFVIALTDILRLSWRFAGRTRQPFLRLGLRLVGWGAVFGLAYCAEKAFYIGARNAGWQPIPDAVQEQMSPLLTGPGCVLILIGFTIPAWGPKVRGLYTYHRLHPLWRLLSEATPEIALDPDATRRGAVRDIDYRLVRLVVEIRDGWLALRPWFDARVARESDGDDPDRVQAAVLAAAVRAKARDEKPAEVWTADPRGGDDIAGETAHLLRIARHLRATGPAPREQVVVR
ncbi:MAB_1171c family putative transporter [Actinoplanes couchii]|uniref:DUF6545 domain-containing protein n=1 Tax=Actinoplanes couchii TaxID=403638 RepID=A0ABQ3WZS3_9ACTN|nr:MAB_1171c family putative transporter [Actinoplanes couchii]MDR6316151.1 hypothetical protein [Actinoplanes couchii]GID51766.1 hypothetical protein Aco03nite_001700 [Actinoplanes couchii]